MNGGFRFLSARVPFFGLPFGLEAPPAIIREDSFFSLLRLGISPTSSCPELTSHAFSFFFPGSPLDRSAKVKSASYSGPGIFAGFLRFPERKCYYLAVMDPFLPLFLLVLVFHEIAASFADEAAY